MNAELSLRLPPETASVSTLLDALESFADAHDIPMATMARLNILADELAANVAMHARGATHFEATTRYADGTLTFSIADDGAPFDPLAQASPDTDAALEDRDIGGLGIHLVREMATSCAYHHDGSRNILTLTLAVRAE